MQRRRGFPTVGCSSVGGGGRGGWGADIRRRLRLPSLLVQAVASAAVLNSQKEPLPR